MPVRILYLEDERWQSEGSVSLALKVDFDYEVQDCFSIEEAHKFLRSTKWDAVVLDIGLNSNRALKYEETSFIVLERIRAGEYPENPPNLPVVFASGVWDMIVEMEGGKRKKVAEIRRSLKVRDSHCVGKPIDVEELHRAIDTARKESDDGV